MPNKRLQQIIAYAKQSGHVNPGLIALWTGLSASSSYLLYLQLRQLCEEGLLDDELHICQVDNKQVIFKKRGEEK